LNFQQGKPLSEQHKTMIIDDNFFVKDGFSGDVVEHARLVSPDHQLSLCLQSNYPCLQVYTGTHLSTPFHSHQGICLEPQFAPNSPNQDAFTLQLTSPQRPLVVSIKYRLVKH
jgi:aldose 1-epimerase